MNAWDECGLSQVGRVVMTRFGWMPFVASSKTWNFVPGDYLIVTNGRQTASGTRYIIIGVATEDELMDVSEVSGWGFPSSKYFKAIPVGLRVPIYENCDQQETPNHIRMIEV